MKFHCLTQQEYYELIRTECKSFALAEDYGYLKDIFKDCTYWDTRIIGFNFFLSIALEKLMKANESCEDVIDFIYELPESMDFDIQECNIEFLDNLFKNKSEVGLSLEECLIDAQKIIYGE